MTLAEWVARQPDGGYGARSELQRRSGLAYTTILRAIDGHPMHRDTAVKLAAATDGAVSIEELLIGDLQINRAAGE